MNTYRSHHRPEFSYILQCYDLKLQRGTAVCQVSTGRRGQVMREHVVRRMERREAQKQREREIGKQKQRGKTRRYKRDQP